MTLIDIVIITMVALLLLGIAAVFTRDGDELIIPDETKVKFPQGTRIVCPHCNRKMAKAKLDINYRSSMDSSKWEWVEGVNVTTNPGMKCPYDGWSYAKTVGLINYLHTRKGWIG